MGRPVPAELAHRNAGFGRVAFRVVAIDSIETDRFHRLGGTGFDQEHLVSSGTAVGIQGLVDTACERPPPLSAETFATTCITAGCGKVLA